MGSRGPVAVRDVQRSGKRRGRRPQPSKAAAPEVVAAFRRVVNAAPWLTVADAPMIEQLAEALVLQQAAFALLVPKKLLIVDRAHGNDLRRNPALIAWRTAAEVARAAAAKLGVSPMDRARLGLEEERDEPSLAQVLFGEAAHMGDGLGSRDE